MNFPSRDRHRVSKFKHAWNVPGLNVVDTGVDPAPAVIRNEVELKHWKYWEIRRLGIIRIFRLRQFLSRGSGLTPPPVHQEPMIMESSPAARVTARCLCMALASLKPVASSLLSLQQAFHCPLAFSLFLVLWHSSFAFPSFCIEPWNYAIPVSCIWSCSYPPCPRLHTFICLPDQDKMRVAQYYATALLAAVSSVSAQAVKGTAYGFASGVTGGADGEVSTPTSASELADLLSDDTARVIDLTQTFDFTGTTKTASGCSPWGTEAACQQALDAASDWCGREQPDAPSVSNLEYDTAALDALKVGSNKSIISSNGKGVLKGKGLSLTSAAKNIIIQGITITDLNPGLVWGGDALELDGNDGVVRRTPKAYNFQISIANSHS